MQFRIGVLVGAGIFVMLAGYLRFCGSVSMPVKPPKPKREVLSFKEVSKRIDAKQVAWEQQLDADSKRFAIRSATALNMSRAFTYRQDTTTRKLIPGKPGASFEAAGLRITAVVVNVARKPHLALKIENLGTTDLAYRIPTRPMRGQRSCRRRGTLAHNAAVVPAGKSLIRTECRHKRRFGLVVLSAETLEVPPLGARYISMVPPAMLGLGAREAVGHKPYQGSGLCPTILGGGLAADIQAGRVSWRDLADFYARHSCATYQFPPGYEAFRVDDERPLPAANAN